MSVAGSPFGKHSKRRQSRGTNAREVGEGRALLFPLRSDVSHLSLLLEKQMKGQRHEKDQENGKGRETSFAHKSLSVFFFKFKQSSQASSFNFSLPQTKRTTLLSSTLGEGCIDTSLFTFSKQSTTKSSCAKIQVFETLPPSWSKFSFFNVLSKHKHHNLPQKKRNFQKLHKRELIKADSRFLSPYQNWCFISIVGLSMVDQTNVTT